MLVELGYFLSHTTIVREVVPVPSHLAHAWGLFPTLTNRFRASSGYRCRRSVLYDGRSRPEVRMTTSARILVVGANPDLCELITMLLQAEGYEAWWQPLSPATFPHVVR